MYLLPVKTKIDSSDRQKNNIPEITNLLQYWLMLENFGGKALEVDYLKASYDDRFQENLDQK